LLFLSIFALANKGSKANELLKALIAKAIKLKKPLKKVN
jgi:hypothetical protein